MPDFITDRAVNRSGLSTRSPPTRVSTLRQTAISISASGDNTVITNTGDQPISIDKIALSCATPVTIILKSGSTTLATFPGVTGFTLDMNVHHEALYQLAVGDSFIINISAAVVVQGTVWWRLR